MKDEGLGELAERNEPALDAALTKIFSDDALHLEDELSVRPLLPAASLLESARLEEPARARQLSTATLRSRRQRAALLPLRLARFTAIVAGVAALALPSWSKGVADTAVSAAIAEADRLRESVLSLDPTSATVAWLVVFVISLSLLRIQEAWSYD